MLCKGLFVRSMVICCALMVQPATASAYDRPCRQDIEKFCSDVSPGGGRVAACLHKHYAELSPECKARGQELHERVQEAQAACKEDIAKYCKQIKPGGGAHRGVSQGT
jgi:hypothetical protein